MPHTWPVWASTDSSPNWSATTTPSASRRSPRESGRAIIESPIPAAVAAELEQAYRELGAEPYVAVRSSGTAEDLGDASFAGLHDTYLDVRGYDNVITAIKRCWASMWNVRATLYRQVRGFDHDAAGIAVVVQRMVSADAAGVMFTANPLNTATDEIVVNANWGLGESVVSGIVTPDQFVGAGRLDDHC